MTVHQFIANKYRLHTLGVIAIITSVVDYFRVVFGITKSIDYQMMHSLLDSFILTIEGFGGLILVIIICYLNCWLPRNAVKAIFKWFFYMFFDIEINGMENYTPGDKSVIIVNHLSFVDGTFVGTFLPGMPTFAVSKSITQQWWAKPFLLPVKIFPVDPESPFTTKSMVAEIKKGTTLVIFPEGRITLTGSLMKVYDGSGMVADKADAPIIPIKIDGFQFSYLSKMHGKLKIRLFPKLVMTILPKTRIGVQEDIKGRARRQIIGKKMQELMSVSAFNAAKTQTSIFQALINASKKYGNIPILEDIERKPINYETLITASFVLGKKLAELDNIGANIGVMLPNSIGGAAAFFGLQAYGRVPAMINYSAGAANITSACHAAGITTIITSKRFVLKAKLEDVITKLHNIKIVYLEDVKETITFFDKIIGKLKSKKPEWFSVDVKPNDPAVVLFTSGSEGTPKGVVLSHSNITSNSAQAEAVVDFSPMDCVFNAMPIFHSFGLTGGMLLPMLYGVKTFLYPSPLHFKIVPEMVYQTRATIMFGTDTFLRGYAKVANPYDFSSLRYIFAGAEKVNDETRKIYAEKFGVRVLEGYGATETSPILSMNTPHFNKAGTVGKLLPGINHVLESVPGIDVGGKLIVSGPNVMLGYYKVDQPGILQPLSDGNYDTGDIVVIDEEGFIKIVGRVKRFAKIAGEMISLSAVEEWIRKALPTNLLAVIAIPDAKKGEALILIVDTYANPGDIKDIITKTKQTLDIPELAVPKIINVGKIPLLGTGKIDYVKLQTQYAETI